jgi:hypothetical protein
MMRRGRWLVCALAVVLARCAPLDLTVPAPSDEEAWAFRTLARTRVVAAAATGVGGTPTVEGCAMRVLLDSEKPHERFEALSRQPRTEARTYAAMGLCVSGSPRCREAREALRGDTTQVSSINGCIGGRMRPFTLLLMHGDDFGGYGGYVGEKGCAPRHMRRMD